MTMRIKALAAACALGALLLSGPAAAGDVTGALITAAERQIFEHYFGGQADAPTGGGTKDKGKSKGKGNKALPQGIAMKLQRGGSLPPGIAKRDLPRDLSSQLPRRPAGQDYAIVDDDVVLIEAATGLILDILVDTARR